MVVFSLPGVSCKIVMQPPTNGKISPTKNEYVFEDVITFQCNKGYMLVGATTTTCTSDGTWTVSAAPKCEGLKT